MTNTKYNVNTLGNNTFSLESLETTYNDLLIQNFDSLYQTQRNLAGIHRFDFTIQDLKLNGYIFNGITSIYPNRYTYSLDFEFIQNHLRYRYKNSSLFNELLTYKDIANNPNIFRYNFMLFIDGQFVSTCEIYPREYNTILSVDVAEGKHTTGISKTKFNELLLKDANISVLFIPNSTISHMETNIHNISNCGMDGIDISRAYNRTGITDRSIAFCNTSDDVSLSKPIHFTKEPDSGRVIFRVNLDIFKSNKSNITWYNLGFDNNVIELRYNEPYFILNETMPVPVENMFVIVAYGDNMEFDHKVKINLYYPNIYKVEGLKVGQRALIYYSYKYDTPGTTEVIHNEISMYHKYTKDIIQEYTLDTVPEFIKSYKPIKVEYSIDDYNESIYVPSILSYKIHNLQKYIDIDPNILTKYLTYQVDKSNKFYMDMSKMDLLSKVRRNTSNEMSNDIVTFDKPQYVFILRTPFTKYQNYELKLFLDGIYLYEEFRYVTNDVDFFYIYIPCDMVKSNSLLEIQRHKLCKYDKLISFNDINIGLPLDISITNGDCLIDDIFITDSTNKYIHRSDYFFTMNIGTNEVTLNPDSNRVINSTLRIFIKTKELLNKPLHIMIRNESFTERAVYEKNTMCYFNIKTKSHANNEKGNYRIFRKGRCLPQNGYAFKNVDTFMKRVDIMLKIEPEPNEMIVTDFSPNNYKPVHFQRDIDNKKGFVDVSGKLDKPINLKWHDIYLNGVKVHKNNIKIISVGKFIISGISTLKNLEIIENSRDYEILRLNSNSYSIEDKIWDEIGSIKDGILDGFTDIEDTLDDIIKDLIDDVMGDRLELFEFLMKFTYINPNISQITSDMKVMFSTILDTNDTIKVDANISDGFAKLVYDINANKRSDIMNDIGNKTIEDVGGMKDRFAISTLYKDNRENALPGELMCNKVTGASLLKREDGTIVSTDELDRLNNHINQALIHCIYLGYTDKDIISLEFDNIDLPKDILYNENILFEGSLIIDNIHDNLLLSLDIDTLISLNNIMTQSNLTPNIIIKYTEDSVVKSIELPISHLLTKPIKVEASSITVDSIIIKRNKDDLSNLTRIVLHSILIIR